MEYKVFNKIRHIPRWLRFGFGLIIFAFGIFSLFIPIIPGSTVSIVVGLLFMVSAHKVRKVVKIRKGLQHLFQNFSKEKLKHKWYDFKKHMRHIIYHD